MFATNVSFSTIFYHFSCFTNGVKILPLVYEFELIN